MVLIIQMIEKVGARLVVPLGEVVVVQATPLLWLGVLLFIILGCIYGQFWTSCSFRKMLKAAPLNTAPG